MDGRYSFLSRYFDIDTHTHRYRYIHIDIESFLDHHMCWVGSRLVLEGSLLNKLFALLRLDSVWGGGVEDDFLFWIEENFRCRFWAFSGLISCLVRGGDLHP